MRITIVVAVVLMLSMHVVGGTDLSDAAEPWRGADVGVTQQVPLPFEALHVEGGRVHCWGRSYALTGPLPASMVSQGRDLLAEPMRLIVEAGGERHVLRGGEVSIDLNRDDRIEYSSQSAAGDFTVSTDNWMEYDGVVQVNLTVQGAGTIDRLAIEMPIDPQVALFLHEHTQWGGYDYLRLPPDTGWQRSTGWHAQTWIGDHERGLTFVTEHPRDLTAIEYERNDDAFVFRATLLDKPTRIDGEMTWTFGLQASPGKPLPTGWHGRHPGQLAGATPAELIERGQNIAVVWNTQTRYFSYPEPSEPEALKSRIDALHDAGIRSVVYITLSGTGPSPVFERNRAEWLMSIEEDKPLFDGGELFSSTCPASTYADWLVWAVDRAVDEYDLDGVYIDNPGPYYCTNDAHGCGGKRGRTYPYFANRDLHKRLWNVIRGRKPEAGLMWEHNSRTSNSFQLTFCDIYSDGEHFRVKSKGEITDITLDLMAITGTGRQWGAQPCFLPSALNLREQWSQWLAARTLPYGNVMMSVPSWMDYSVLSSAMRARLAFELDEQPVEWFTPEATPAWLPVTPDEGVLIGGYRRQDGAVLLTASNVTGEKLQARVDLRPLESQVGGQVSIRDALTDAPCTRLGPNLVISIPSNAYRMIRIEPGK